MQVTDARRQSIQDKKRRIILDPASQWCGFFRTDAVKVSAPGSGRQTVQLHVCRACHLSAGAVFFSAAGADSGAFFVSAGVSVLLPDVCSFPMINGLS